MFETAELGQRLDKGTFAERTKTLRIDLLKVQRELASADVPVLIVIGGIDGSGKGERARPPYWRFWMAQIPRRGKIGPEDYRNRQKTNAYESAAGEMIGRTSTEYAPWTLVEAEEKHYARVKVLRAACQRIEKAL